MSLRERRSAPPSSEESKTALDMASELERIESELKIARDRTVRAEEERDAAETKNAELRREVKEKGDLLLKALSALEKAEQELATLKKPAAEDREAKAEKKPEAVATAPETRRTYINVGFLTTEERDGYFQAISRRTNKKRVEAEAAAREDEAWEAYLRDLARRIAERE